MELGEDARLPAPAAPAAPASPVAPAARPPASVQLVLCELGDYQGSKVGARPVKHCTKHQFYLKRFLKKELNSQGDVLRSVRGEGVELGVGLHDHLRPPVDRLLLPPAWPRLPPTRLQGVQGLPTQVKLAA